MPLALAGVFGAMIGSFLNVVAYRLPRRESLAFPPSHCPRCDTPIRVRDNIPVLGWLALRGRCRSCREPIAIRYPLVEALSALLAVSVVLVKHGPHDLALGLTLVAVLIPLALIDLDHRIIPNRITAPAAAAALIIGVVTRPSGVVAQLAAGGAAAGFLLIFALAYPAGMGMGDVKLAGVLGLFLGPSVAVAILVAVVAGSLAGGLLMARHGVQKGRKTGIPFGPYLALGGVVALLVGPAVLHWYLHAGL
jgi:leader peptidase (prepilin peptidase)/N-methyltransferase